MYRQNMARLIFSLLLLATAVSACATDPLYSRVRIELTHANRTQLLTAMNAVSNRVERAYLQGDVEQIDGRVVTNSGTYSGLWFLTFNSTNYARPLYQYVATNTLVVAGGAKVHCSVHLCPCGPTTNPPVWVPCYINSLSGYTFTNR